MKPLYQAMKDDRVLHRVLTTTPAQDDREAIAATRVFRVLVDEWGFMPPELQRAFATVLQSSIQDQTG